MEEAEPRAAAAGGHMLVLVLAFLGGVLTIVSPCILPVIPFVFARSERPFRRGTLPLLLGMAVTFAVFASLATVGGHWIVAGNEYGRWVAMLILAGLGLSLLVPSLAERVARPVVRMGARLRQRAQAPAGAAGTASAPGKTSAANSVVLGAAIGLLWAPCAGPILGLVLAAAAIGGASPRTLGLLLSFAAGAAVSLAVLMWAGDRLLRRLKRGLAAESWVRRGLGAAVLVAVVAISLGADTQLLAAVAYVNTNGVEQKLVDLLAPRAPAPGGALPATARGAAAGLASDPAADPRVASITVSDVTPVVPPLDREGGMPPLKGATAWINSPPLTRASLRGKVVLVDFWTYSCINCLRSLPYIEAWWRKYQGQGLVVIGVHSPEFAFERKLSNVQAAVKRLKLTFPIAVDSDHKIWNAFHNRYWPADYFIDASGEIRAHHFGEGEYAESERVIQELLAQAHHQHLRAESLVSDSGMGAEAPADFGQMDSPETYIGYERAARFTGEVPLVPDLPETYTPPSLPTLNQWGLGGAWTDHGQYALLRKAPGVIVFRFHARDLHLVLGSKDGKPIRFRVTIDGGPPGPNHGVDCNAAGEGTVTTHRLYQLIRQKGPIEDRTFRIQFLDKGVQAYSFTFG